LTQVPPSSSDPHEISGVLSRVNQLGEATNRLFSRLYLGLKRRSEQESGPAASPQRRAEVRKQIELARAMNVENQLLQNALKTQALKIEQMNGILDAMDVGVIMQDSEGRIAHINKAARDLLGSQKNFWESEIGLLFNEHRDVTHVEGELMPLGEARRVQVNNRILGAQLAAVANPDGERLGTMVMLRDVTRDALADRLKEQFVTAISHELKTPMTVIKGMSEVLLRSPEDAPPNRRLLETLSRNVDILDRMVVELLDVSEMGAEAFSIRQNAILLNPLIASVANGLLPEVKKNRLEINYMPRDTRLLQITGDEQRLRWALGHLIQNSIRYTEPGGRIFLTAAIDEQTPTLIVVEVVDTGVGISEKDLPHIFERFYRGEPRTPSGKLLDPRGLGQGLFIARKVAEAHGGYLRAESEQGRGSVFTLVLPRRQD
jgi:two-component system phosphate regulon sensor histidine kinase PhoR